MNIQSEEVMRAIRFHHTAAIAAALAFQTFALPLPAFADATAPAWETLRTEDGIQVARRVVPGSPFVAFRGEGDVDAPLLLVGSVLVDIDRDHEWIDSVAEARVLRQVSRTEYVTYSHVATPPTMSDRDFVMDVTIEPDAATRSLVVRMHSVDDPSAPKTSYVRGNMRESTFTLTSIDGGKRTHVVAEVHCDPKGSIASWIVNLFQKSWGYNTLHALRAQLTKKDIAVHPLLSAVLEEKGFYR
jgi:hypothetical protein